MKPITMLARNIMEGKTEQVWKMAENVGIKLTNDEKELTGKKLFKAIFKKWIPAADALLEMIILRLPSPAKAQKYRAAYLYDGPIDDECG